jgi:DNA-binding transcriptional MerR regulator
VDKAPDAFRTISEVADDLDVPQHVLRFWETRFPHIKPMKRGGGRRYYRPDDVDLLRGIRHLLYGEGYTIRGVQRILKDSGIRFVQSVWKSGAPQPEPPRVEDASDGEENAGAAAEPILARGEPTIEQADRGPVAVEQPASTIREQPARQLPRSNLQPLPGPAERIAPDIVQGAGEPRPVAASRPLDALRKLQSTLYELGECRRLLDTALKDEG